MGGRVLMCERRGLRAFDLHHVLGKRAAQEEAFETVGRPLLDAFLAGSNACLFAYGQTSSGKTHSMWGPGGGAEASGADAGLAPRACAAVWREVEEQRAKGGSAELKLTLVEVLGECVTDLLTEGPDGASSGRTVQVRALRAAVLRQGC